MKDLSAFTLIELLVVVVLVGIMAAIASYLIGNHSEEAQASMDAANARVLQNQVEFFRARNGNYPSSLADLLNANPPYVREIPGGEEAWAYDPGTGVVSRAE